MPIYLYRGRNRAGGLLAGSTEADSAEAVATELMDAGIIPVQIAREVRKADWRDALPGGWAGSRVGLDDLIIFCRQMYTLARSGIPIIRGITALSDTTRNPALAQALRDISESLRAGRELSEAFSRHPRIFSNLFISVVHVGENTGKLDEAFRQMGSYLELDRETRRRIKAATRYPMFVVCAICIAMVVINVFVIPAFARVFASFNAELPWATRLLIATSEFTVNYWPFILVGTGVAAALLRGYVQTEQGRLLWDRFKLKIPAIGNIIERATLARYAQSVAMTFSAGVPAVEALQVVAKAADNEYLSSKLAGMRAAVSRGESLSRAATASGIFTPLILQMMTVGEETGQIAEMHTQISDAYEAEVDYDLKRLSDAIEPILIVGIGAVVLVLALGVYLPMWDMATAVKQMGG
jgi:MSHA biogenesis protein MshG